MAEATSDPRIGTVLEGRYLILARIAEGGMGVVYRGERVQLERPVAIKFLHPWMAAQPALLKRFEVEARAMSRLAHPHCVSVIDFGVSDAPYLVMDMVSGRTLREVLDAGPLPQARALNIGRQVLAGLAHAHGQGIVHRDIKPDNIVLARTTGLEDHVRILDFGLAKLLDGAQGLTTGLAVGTPCYMAPEQTGEGSVDARVDVYAAGVLLFEILTRQKPFDAPDVAEVLRQQREVPPPRLRKVAPEAGFSQALEELILRAMAKSPDDRFPTAAAMAAALDAVPDTAPAGRRGSTAPGLAPAAGNGATAFQVGSPGQPQTAIPGAPVAPPRPGPPAAGAPAPRGGPPPGAPRPARKPDETIVDPSIIIVGPNDASSEARTIAVQSPGARTIVDRSMWYRSKLDAARAGLGRARGRLGGRVAGSWTWLRAKPTRLALAAGGVVVMAGILVPLAVSDGGPPPAARPAAADSAAPVAAASTAASAPAGLAEARKLAADGQRDLAIGLLADLRRGHPRDSEIAALLARLYFEKRWWSDGLAAYRAALDNDPAKRQDTVLIGHVISSLISERAADKGEAFLIRDLRDTAKPHLEEAARSHDSATVRARAARILEGWGRAPAPLARSAAPASHSPRSSSPSSSGRAPWPRR